MAPTGRAGRCGVESLEPSLNPVDALELGDLVSIHFMFLSSPCMHAAFWNGGYPHYRSRFGADATGEGKWAQESVTAFTRCSSNFSAAACALSFESLTRENEETFYHCDQLISPR